MSNTSWIERYVMPAALRIAGQKHVLSVRDGIILNMPFMLIGSFFLIFAYLPIPGYADMMSSLFGEVWRDKMLYPVKATYDIMALISSFGIAYRLAEKYRTLDPLSAGAMSLVAFMMTIPQNTLFTPVHGAAEVIKGVIPVSMVGSQGLFVAIVISLLSTEIYRLVASRNLVIRMPDGVPPAVAKSFLLLGLVIFMLLRSRSQQMKQLGKIAAPGALFNISEPMVFGIPLVMNPYFFLPFILTPVLLVIVSYTAMATGLVAPPAGIALPFTTPIFISGYLATGGHISGTVLQVVNLAISLVVYYPFFRAWDRLKAKEEHASAQPQASAAIADADRA